jgi:hypothetical protein
MIELRIIHVAGNDDFGRAVRSPLSSGGAEMPMNPEKQASRPGQQVCLALGWRVRIFATIGLF